MLEMKVKSIDAKIITVESEHVLVLHGLTSKFTKHTVATVGETIYVSLRPESFQAGPDDSAIKGLNPSLEEAATSLGASQIYVWRKVTPLHHCIFSTRIYSIDGFLYRTAYVWG